MAPRGQKRAAAEAAKAAENKRRATEKAVKAKCTSVSSAMSNAVGIPDPVCTMLSEAVSGSLAEYKDTRHPFQDNVLTMVGQALAGIEASNQQSIDAAQGAVAGVDAEQASRKAAVTAAEENLTAKKTAVGEMKVNLKNAEAELKDATKALESADHLVKNFTSDVRKANQALANAQDAMTTFVSGPKAAFQELKDHTTPPPEPEEPEEPEAPEVPAAEVPPPVAA